MGGRWWCLKPGRVACVRPAQHRRRQGGLYRYGWHVAGTNKSSTILGEIDNEEKRMVKLNLMTRRLGHKYVVLKTLADQPGHDRARFGESWLTRQLGLSNLMNRRHGGAGRRPFYDYIGAVFVLVGE